MKSSKILLMGCAVMLATSSIAFAHVEAEFFLPQVADPSAMTIDGDESDWGWFDRSFAMTPEGFFDASGNDGYSKEDFDFALFMAWSQPPDNRLWGFYRVQDDTLTVVEEDPKRWWADDNLQLTIDIDHSGGDFLGVNLDHVNTAQRYHIRILPLPGQAVFFNSLIEQIDLPSILWNQDIFEGEQTEVIEVAWTLSPAGSSNGSLNVSYTIEWAMETYDITQPTKDESVRHIFAPDQVVHLGPRPNDADTIPFVHRLIPIGSDEQQDQKGDFMPDFYTFCEDCPNAGTMGGEGMTAVEEDSWGRIKSHMQSQLR
jgi:hypothetical protein